MAGISPASLTAEFIGTFLLVLTVGCNVKSGNAVWGGVSIACSLMVGIYALGGASGANFNPAVSVALGLAKKMEGGWAQVGAYCAVQLIGGYAAALCYGALFGTFTLGPAPGFSMVDAFLCEMFYTFMLCFVVLNTAASKKIATNPETKNQFYGLSIGFVIIAGAYGAGAVSGGCFNPAVAFAIDASSRFVGGGYVALYWLAEILGSGVAVAAFMLVRPEEKTKRSEPAADSSLQSKLVAEFIGTFILVLTVGLNVLGQSKAGAFSIAASLICMINAIGDVSGGHFNPAVTLALWLRGGNKISSRLADKYVFVQLLGGVAAAFTYTVIHNGENFPLQPQAPHGWLEVAVAETIFTMVLCLVVLGAASAEKQPAPEMIGLAIGSCVTVGGFAIGKVSGGSLNPAVSIGISASHLINGGSLFSCVCYTVFELFGAMLAAMIFISVSPSEYATKAVEAPVSSEKAVDEKAVKS